MLFLNKIFKLNINLGIILVLALLLRIFIFNLHLNNPNFSIQQDEYLDYTYALKDGTIGNSSSFAHGTRLFPGYPIAITIGSIFALPPITSAVYISIFSSVLAIYLIFLLTKSLKTTAFFAFFPPIWVIQGTKIATEPITIAFLLLALYLFLRKKPFWAGIILGFSFNIRIISICLLIALTGFSLFKKRVNDVKRLVLGFTPFFLGLFIYNFFIFGENGIFKQFTNLSGNYNGLKIGLFQIINDLPRALAWHQYRIFASGSFYIIFIALGLYLLYKNRQKSDLIKICLFWSILSICFVLSLSPTPLLEDFARYLTPIMPAMAVAFTYKGDKTDEK
jgi:Gpi18-like mannosyltransferase